MTRLLRNRQAIGQRAADAGEAALSAQIPQRYLNHSTLFWGFYGKTEISIIQHDCVFSASFAKLLQKQRLKSVKGVDNCSLIWAK
jgi:hypothetical protein